MTLEELIECTLPFLLIDCKWTTSPQVSSADKGQPSLPYEIKSQSSNKYPSILVSHSFTLSHIIIIIIIIIIIVVVVAFLIF
jgi:hypothetical protein